LSLKGPFYIDHPKDLARPIASSAKYISPKGPELFLFIYT